MSLPISTGYEDMYYTRYLIPENNLNRYHFLSGKLLRKCYKESSLNPYERYHEFSSSTKGFLPLFSYRHEFEEENHDTHLFAVHLV